MTSIVKTLHRMENRFNTFGENLVYSHPFIAFILMFIAMPAVILTIVALVTVIVTVPLGWLFGWL